MDDLAAALRFHVRIRRLAEEIDSLDIHVGDEIEIILRHCGDGFAAIGGRIVDENIDAPSSFDRFLDDRPTFIDDSQVSGHRYRMAACLGDSMGRIFSRRRRPGMRHNRSSCLGQGTRQHPSDAACGPGHESGFAFKRKKAVQDRLGLSHGQGVPNDVSFRRVGHDA